MSSPSHHLSPPSPTSPYPQSLHPTSARPQEASSHPMSPYPASEHGPTSGRPEEESSQLRAQVMVVPLYTDPSSNGPPPVPGGRFDLQVPRKCMGTGFYGDVWEAEHNGRYFAVKKYNKTLKTAEELEQKFLGLISLELEHENVMAYCGVGSIVLENTKHFVAVMERVEQNLVSYVFANRGALDPRKKLEILAGIASGLAYLHSRGRVHQDLIPTNVLVAPECKVKIADYGNVLVKPILTASAECRQEIAFFREYLPPEALENEDTEPKPSFDAFSFGHMSLLVILETHPHPIKPPTYFVSGKYTPRTEVQRREKFIDGVKVRVNGSELEPLTGWIEECLCDEEDQRPEIRDFSALM